MTGIFLGCSPAQAATTVTLPAGGRLEVDPQYDAPGPVTDVGRVRAYNSSGTLVGTLVGSTANDQIGSGGVTLLSDEAYVISSPLWNNGALADAGAATWGATYSPRQGTVSSSNSLVGSSANDQVGTGGVSAIGEHLWIVRSPQWDNGAAANAGAVTIMPISSFSVGLVSSSNSLVGSSTDDQIGSGGISTIGQYLWVIHSPQWSNGSAANAGAVTSMPVSSFSVGPVSASNSLVGSSTDDQIGTGGISTIGQYLWVIRSPNWDNGAATNAGAVTTMPNTSFSVGPVSSSNSLVGSSPNDQIGSAGISTVGQNLWVIRSPNWDNGAAANAGAVTTMPNTSFSVGPVSSSNSLVGGSTNDQIGSAGVSTIGQHLWVVRSPNWDNGAVANAGAVTTMSNTSWRVGPVAPENSLVGTTANDQVGNGGVSTVGQYLWTIRSPQWDNGTAVNTGAVTTMSNTSWRVGPVAPENSLVGSTTNDQIGVNAFAMLGTDMYYMINPQWDNGSLVDAGAITMSDATSYSVGPVTASNSLIGGSAGDQVGSGGATVVDNTVLLIRSPLWDHGPAADAGAVSRAFASFFSVGLVSSINSLVGSHPNDQVGSGGITIQGTTNYTISSPTWCYGAGASTAGSTTFVRAGVVSALNSTVGSESSVPEIVVQQPVSTEIVSNGSRDFGSVAMGSTQGMVFTIKNTGTDDLLLSGSPRVVFSGADAAAFSVVAQPPSFVVTGDTTSFTVNFTSSTEGAKTAMLSIANNDSNENPYRINLTATVLSRVAGWRQTHFGSPASTGMAGDGADFDQDGIPNLVEYALGLHPAQNSAGQLPLAATVGGQFGMSFASPAGMSGITYGAEWSDSLAPGSWQPATDTGTPPQHVFRVPVGTSTRVFMRLKILSAP